jgi:uncharacterized protein (UPF0332 family)
MSTTVTDLWIHAQQLPQATEECSRAKISRAYYALYHHALQFHDDLDSEGLLPAKPGGQHRKLTHQLVNPTSKNSELCFKSRQIGTYLGLAREKRVNADYHPEKNLGKTEVAECLRYVRTGLAVTNIAQTKQA